MDVEHHAFSHGWDHEIHVILTGADHLELLLLALDPHGLENDRKGNVLREGVVLQQDPSVRLDDQMRL